MKKQLIRIGIKIGIVAVLVAGLLLFVVTVRVQHSNNMYPAMRDGQLCLFVKPAEPILDQVVLYKDPAGIERVGRIVAQSGDGVEIAL